MSTDQVSQTRHRRQIHHLAEATKVLAEKAASALRDIWMVVHWKFDLDPGTPRWRVLYRDWIFRPFLDFSFKHVKIPTPKGVIIEGKKLTYFWFENGGHFETEDQADIACVTDFHGYKRQPYNRSMPLESAQYDEITFPRRKNPRPRLQPVLDLLLISRKQQTAIQSELVRLREILNHDQ